MGWMHAYTVFRGDEMTQKVARNKYLSKLQSGRMILEPMLL